MKKSAKWYKTQIKKITKEKQFTSLKFGVMPDINQSEYKHLKEVYHCLKNFDPNLNIIENIKF